MPPHERKLIDTLRQLSPKQQSQVERLILALGQGDPEGELRHAYALASQEAFTKIWDNDEDAIYDTL